MKKASIFLIILSLLLLFHTQVVTGARNGLLLWYQILIPSLLPFILVTNALSETNAYACFAEKLYPFFHERTYEIIAVSLGNLCGYPIGGKIISSFINAGVITPKRGNELLPLASSASPMFIVGYVYTHILDKRCSFIAFLAAIYIPTIIGYVISIHPKVSHTAHLYTASECQNHSITETFMQSVQTMVYIGIYVMIFSIIYEVVLPICDTRHFQIPLSFLEITTGLNLLKAKYMLHPLYSPIIGALTTSGGLCSAFQIYCVFTEREMQIKKYLRNKCILSAGTFLLLLLYQTLC